MERGSVTRSGFDGSEAFGISDDVNRGGVLRLTELRPYRNAQMTTTLKELWFWRANEKRWRATAVQDADAFTMTTGWREASWSAPALWRFGRR